MAIMRNGPRWQVDAPLYRGAANVSNATPNSTVPYKDLLYGSRGDTITTTDENGQVTNVTGGNPPAVEEAEAYDFMGSPGAQFRLGFGLDQVQNSLVGRGLGLSGRAAKEMERFRQNYAADEFNSEFARNATLAGLQPPSIGSMNALVGNFGANAGNLAMNAGQIGANSAYNNANIYGNALNNIIQGFGQYYMGGFGG